ncbi:hypothetical protein PENTCL1PPCAC_27282 [Pristionchus entomophagus]|uniref:Integrase catalytic domain-containing protein n=1 Tax=Pristionchus entomophagus TaxID=358040 RepID=A0AAV5UFM4_9BILA|nr:hypothetical protein PENTCL1PPCAC_27282 [Pristionchus entomophagus]
MLSKAASPFDPLGFLNPLLLPPRLSIQNLWNISLKWDEPVDTSTRDSFHSQMSELATSTTKMELYSLVMSHTLLRLTVDALRKEFTEKPIHVYTYSDSAVVLHWCKPEFSKPVGPFVSNRSVIDLSRYSPLNKAISITALVYRFISRCASRVDNPLIHEKLKHIPYSNSSELSAKEKRFAHNSIIRLHQTKHTPCIDSLKKTSIVVEDTSTGLWKSNSRLTNSKLSSESKFPIFIPTSVDSSLAKLIISDIHWNSSHASIDIVLNEVKRQYWIPRCRQIVVNSLLPSSFALAFRRFCSRRGTPIQITSDQATTFKMASTLFAKHIDDDYTPPDEENSSRESALRQLKRSIDTVESFWKRWHGEYFIILRDCSSKSGQILCTHPSRLPIFPQ